MLDPFPHTRTRLTPFRYLCALAQSHIYCQHHHAMCVRAKRGLSVVCIGDCKEIVVSPSILQPRRIYAMKMRIISTLSHTRMSSLDLAPVELEVSRCYNKCGKLMFVRAPTGTHRSHDDTVLSESTRAASLQHTGTSSPQPMHPGSCMPS